MASAVSATSRCSPLNTITETRSWIKLRVIKNVWFERAMLCVILLNACVLAAMDPLAPAGDAAAAALNDIDFACTIVFAIEMGIKMFALGLVSRKVIGKACSALRCRAKRKIVHPDGENSSLEPVKPADTTASTAESDDIAPYFETVWGWLDATVVMVALVSLSPEIDGGGASALRLLRLLRPLKTITSVPKMRIIVGTLLSSIRSLLQVIFVLLFIFFVFAIIGLQTFGGVLHQGCVPFGAENDTLAAHFSADKTDYIPRDDPHTFIGYCSTYSDALPEAVCGVNSTCAAVFEDPRGGSLSFDNFALSIWNIYTTTSMSDWSNVASPLIATTSLPVVAVYFILLQLCATFFAFNLILAVLTDTYSELAQKTAQQQQQQGMDAHAVALQEQIGGTAVEESLVQLWASVAGRGHVQEAAADEMTGTVDNPIAQSSHALAKTAAASRQTEEEIAETRHGELGGEGEPGIAATPSRVLISPQMSEGFASADNANNHNNNKQLEFANHAEDMQTKMRDELQPSEEDVIRLKLATQFAQTAEQVLTQRYNWLSGKPRLLHWCQQLVLHPYFNAVMMLAIVANTVTLACDHEGISDSALSQLEAANIVLTAIFAAEMVLKLIGLGPRNYVREPANIFDGVIVLASVIDIIVNSVSSGGGGSAAAVMRVFRVLRILKLANRVDSLRRLVDVVFLSIADIFWMTILMFLFCFIFAVLGRQLYAGTAESLAVKPDWSFATFQDAFLSVFQIVTSDAFPSMVQDTMEAVGNATPILYFVPLHFFGGYVLLSLYVAILLQRFEDEEEHTHNDEECIEIALKHRRAELTSRIGAATVTFTAPTITIKALYIKLLEDDNRQAFEKEQRKETHASSHGMRCEGKAFNLIPSTNSMRQKLFRLISSIWFEAFVIVLIVFNCIVLALDNPFVDPNSTLADVISICDIVFSALFILEALAKMVALGVFVPQHGYFRSKFNVLDFVIVVVSVVSLIFPAAVIIRSLRALRPLRVVVRSKQIRVVVEAIVYAIPYIMHVFGLVVLVWVIFGILGVSLFKGVYYACSEDANETEADCVAAGGSWEPLDANFDNIGAAVITLFQMATRSGWTGITRFAVQRSGQAAVLYFYAFIVVGSLFAMQLFVSVVVNTFQRLRKELDGSAFMTKEQQQWANQQKLIGSIQLKTNAEKPAQWWRAGIYAIAEHRVFDSFILTCIVMNAIVMCLQYYGQSEAFAAGLDATNLAFTVVFALEATIKITAYGWFLYWKDGWNKFDFIIVLISVIGAAINLDVGTQVFRIFRIARVLRIVHKAKTLRQLVQTLIQSVPSLWNISGLLFILFYIFSIVGVAVFGTAPLTNPDDMEISIFANFQNFGNAMWACWRAATGDAWEGIMFGTAKFLGSAYVGAIFFWIAFQIIVSQTMINLFVAVVLEQAADAHHGEEIEEEMEHLKSWATVWNTKYDPLALKVVRAVSFVNLLRDGPVPFGFGGKTLSRMQLLRKLATLRVPLYKREAAMFKQLRSRSGTARPESKVLSPSDARTVTRVASRKDTSPGKKFRRESIHAAPGRNGAKKHVWCVQFDKTLAALAASVLALDVQVEEAGRNDVEFMHRHYAVSIIEAVYLGWKTRQVMLARDGGTQK